MATGKRKIGGGQKYFGYKSSDVQVCMGELMCDQRLVTVATVFDKCDVHHNAVLEMKSEPGRGQCIQLNNPISHVDGRTGI